MINFRYIKRFFVGDGRFNYMHDISKNEMLVELSNGQKFVITKENKVFKAVYILPYGIKVTFIIFDEDSFEKSIETIYKLATASDDQSEEDKLTVSAEDIKLALASYGYTVAKYLAIEGDPSFNAEYGSDVNIFISRDKYKWIFQCKYLDEVKIYEENNIEGVNSILSDYVALSDYNKQSKEAIKYPRGGNTMYKQTVNNKNFDFLNDYKVVKLAERAINDNFAELANDFIKYSNSEKDSGTILSCGNSKVLFSATKFNRKITIEFGRDGEEPFRYVYTNKGINLLNDYDPMALITIGNLIESAVDAWLENDKNRMNIEDLNERLLSVVDNIKTMIGLINTTIEKYNA